LGIFDKARPASEHVTFPIHGGTGFMEEAGAAQFYRDARIPGNRSQETLRDRGAVVKALLARSRRPPTHPARTTAQRSLP
jgi:hypothetical protein